MPNTQSIIDHFPTILQALSIFGAAVAFVWGVNQWKREYIGKRRIELVEEVLSLSYQIQDIIAFMRNPWAREGEGSSREPGAHESQSEKRARDLAFVPFERYNNNAETFNRLLALRYRFMALVGKQNGALLEELNSVVHRVLVAARLLGNFWVEQGRALEANREMWIKRIEDQERIFWDYGDDDSIKKELESIVNKIEDVCRPYIKA